MDSVYLAYGRTLIEDCEDAWNESVAANITATADAEEMVGTYSAKLTAGDTIAGNTVLATEVVAPGTLVAHTHLVWWSKTKTATSAGDYRFLLDNSGSCASPLETLNFEVSAAGRWRSNTVAFVTPANLTAVISAGVESETGMDAGDYVFVDDVFATTARQFSTLSVRGLDRPDDVVFWPPVKETLLDGTLHEDINAFRRRITIDLKVLTSVTDFNFLMTWLRNDYKYIIGTNDIVRVVLEDPESHAFEWLSGLDVTKASTITCLERNVRTAHPASWGY